MNPSHNSANNNITFPAGILQPPNTATVSSEVDDPASANDSASATTTVSPVADVSVTKSGAPNPVAPGGMVTYTIVIGARGTLQSSPAPRLRNVSGYHDNRSCTQV